MWHARASLTGTLSGPERVSQIQVRPSLKPTAWQELWLALIHSMSRVESIVERSAAHLRRIVVKSLSRHGSLFVVPTPVVYDSVRKCKGRLDIYMSIQTAVTFTDSV